MKIIQVLVCRWETEGMAFLCYTNRETNKKWILKEKKSNKISV